MLGGTNQNIENRFVNVAGATLPILLVLWSVACGPQPEPWRGMKRPSQQLVTELEKTAGVRLPNDAMVCYEFQFGQAWSWIIVSESDFVLPKQYHSYDTPSQPLVEQIQAELKRTIGKPVKNVIRGYKWDTKEAQYRASSLLTSEGGFLYLEKFLREGKP